MRHDGSVQCRLRAIAGAIAMALMAGSLAPALSADWELPPPNAKVDYQIGGDYRLPPGVGIVSRDWFSGKAPAAVYAICYVNAFQTQADERGVNRPDEKSNWPRHLVLTKLGDDPKWGGEYLIDLSTAQKRKQAAAWVKPMIETCADKGFEAVELDNLDSWTRFEGTPREDDVPFGRAEAVAYAALLVAETHRLGLAAAQKNTVQLTKGEALERIGFDFAVAEECGRYRECQAYREVYGNRVIVIEYRGKDFRNVCQRFGANLSIVLRDVNVTMPGSKTYVYRACCSPDDPQRRRSRSASPASSRTIPAAGCTRVTPPTDSPAQFGIALTAPDTCRVMTIFSPRRTGMESP